MTNDEFYTALATEAVNIRHRREQRSAKERRYQPVFDILTYTATFHFATLKEKRHLFDVMTEAWRWGVRS